MSTALEHLAAMLAWSSYPPTSDGPPWRILPPVQWPDWRAACDALEVVAIEDGWFGVTARTYRLAEMVVKKSTKETA